MCRPDYLKHLMANTSKTQTMPLLQETIERIKKQAAMATNKRDAQLRQRSMDYGRQISFLDGYEEGHEAGATEWAEKAQGLVDALEMSRREIVALYKTKGYSESFVTRTIDEAIAKYKEVSND